MERGSEARIEQIERDIEALKKQVTALRDAVGRHQHQLWEHDAQGRFASEVTCDAPDEGWDAEPRAERGSMAGEGETR